MIRSGVILVVDNEPRQRELVEAYLVGQGHKLVFVEGASAALAQAAHAPPDVVLLSGGAPTVAGVCRQLRADASLASTPILALVSADDTDARVLAVEAGVDDLLGAPPDVFELRSRVRTMVRLSACQRRAEAYETGSHAALLCRTLDATLESWGHALELRGIEPEGHTARVTDMALQLAHGMGMSDAQLVHVRRGATVHDIGKMGIPDRITFKVGPLDEGEWEEMRRHPVYAYELLSPIDVLGPAIDIPHYHHEKWDGTGYPEGQRGDAIPLGARVFAVVDVWDALHADRSYRRAWSNGEVDDYVREQAGEHFDPEVVQAFFDLLR